MNLRKWLEDLNNLYVGRRGRIFIKNEKGDNEIFHYKESICHNLYKVGSKKDEYTLEESLKLYRQHILNSELKDKLNELEGKTLGCFCDQKNDCHAKVLVNLYNLENNKR